jgi:AcrR family transcriptional regulator
MRVARRRKRAKPRPGAERREQLLEAALHAFERRGYHGTHVADVIREAGVARGTFYLYFQSKHDAFEALIDRMLGIFLGARPPGIEEGIRTAEDAERVLRGSVRTVLETFRRHRRLCRLLLEEAVGLDKGFAERLERHLGVWRERVGATRAHFVELGIARPDLDVEVTADAVVGMVLHLTRRHLFRESPPDLDRLVDAIVRLEMDGIRAR